MAFDSPAGRVSNELTQSLIARSSPSVPVILRPFGNIDLSIGGQVENVVVTDNTKRRPLNYERYRPLRRTSRTAHIERSDW